MNWLRELPALIRRHRLDTLLVVTIGLLAVGLRLFALDRRSLWLDEIFQARCITPDWNFLLTCLRGYGNESPLPFAATFLWYRLAGSATLPQPDWFMRLPAALAGIFCIPVAWRLGDVLLGRRGAWLLALLWSVLPVAIDASQQVLPYSWLLLFSLVTTLLLVLALERGRLVYWALWGVTAALTVLSGYTAFLFFAGQVAFILAWFALRLGSESRADLAKRQLLRKNVVGGFLGLLAGLVTLAPAYWDVIGFFNSITQPRATVPFVPLSGTYLAGMSTWLLWGQIAWWDIQSWSTSAWPLIALAGLALLGLVWLGTRERIALLLALGLFLSPLIYLFLGKGVPATPRLFLYLLVPYSLILTAGMLAGIEWLTRLKVTTPLQANRVLTLLGAGLILVSFAPKLINYYTASYDDWRGAAQYIRANAGPTDAILTLGKSFAFVPRDPLQYYLPAPPYTLTIAELASLTRPQITRLESRQGRTWGIIWDDGSFTQEQLTRWGGTDFAVVPFGSFTLLAPKTASGTTLASGAANLAVHFRELAPNVPDDTILRLLSDYGGEKNLLRNPSFKIDSGGGSALGWWEVYNSKAYVMNEKGASTLVVPHTENDGEALVIQHIDLKPGATYVLTFEYRNALSRGNQRVDLAFVKSNGEWTGGTFYCIETKEWLSGAIRYTVTGAEATPQPASVFLRNTGVGQVYFRNLKLTEIEGSH